jgi:glucokinase
MKNNPDSLMWQLTGGIDNVSGRTAFDAMRQGDEAAAAVVDKYIYYLSIGIGNVINALQPEIICIGGGVSHEGDYLLKPLQKYIEEQRYSIYSSKQTQIVAAQLGNDAGIFGAALLDE